MTLGPLSMLFQGEKAVRRSLLGHESSILSYEEHKQIFNTSGLDIDNRYKTLGSMLELAGQRQAVFQSFCRDVLNFRNFSEEEQHKVLEGRPETCINRPLPQGAV